MIRASPDLSTAPWCSARAAGLLAATACVSALLLSDVAATRSELPLSALLAPRLPECGAAQRGGGAALALAAGAAGGRALAYTPSALEEEWAAFVGSGASEAAHSICTRLLADDGDGFARTQSVVRGLELQARVVRSGGAHGGEAGAEALSAYRAALASGGLLAPLLSRLGAPGAPGAAVLEPLFGALRDPRWLCEMSGTLQPRIRDLARAVSDELGSPPYNPWMVGGRPSTTELGHYFLLDADALGAFARGAAAAAAAAPAGEAPPRALYFDAGASFWGDGFGLKQVLAHYAAMGLPFDEVFAWESSRSYNGGDFFADAPLRTQHATHYVNMPVVTAPGDRNNPLSAIALVARPQDYVVFKLDVDNSAVELALTEQLISNVTLLALVDEFFFEDHVDVREMHTFWSEFIGSGRTLRDSYELFGRLRAAGVRAHSYP